jgi:transcriptional regulator with XRE-family HTH domain
MVQEKIRNYLKDKGIKYTKVCADIGVSLNTFSQIMNGNRVLKADEFFRICKSLDVSPEIFDPDNEIA